MTTPKEFSSWMSFLFFLGENYAFYATMRFYARKQRHWGSGNVAMWRCADMAGCHVWQPFVSGGKLWRERAGRLVNSIHSGVA